MKKERLLSINNGKGPKPGGGAGDIKGPRRLRGAIPKERTNKQRTILSVLSL
jgi:hypothetical protein